MASYEVYMINDDGSKTLVTDTNIDLAGFSLVYDTIAQKASNTLTEYLALGDLTGEGKVDVISNTMNTLITQSLSSVIGMNTINKDIELKNIQIATEKMKQKRQYGATFDEATNSIDYLDDDKSVIEKQIKGFDMSNHKSILQSYQQAVGMIYNSGNEIPAYYVDVIKKVTELLSNKEVDFESVSGTTELTPESDWK